MNLDVRQIDDSAMGEWNSYVEGHSVASHYHRYEWRNFYAEYFGKQTIYFAAYQSGKIVAVLPLVRQKSRIFGDYLISLPFFNYGGVLSDSDDATRHITESANNVAETLGVSFIEYRQYDKIAAMPSRTEKVSMRLQLPDSLDEIGRAIGSKRRSQIRRPLRENPTVQIGGIELVDQFYDVFSRNMRDIGTPVYARSMFAEIFRTFPGEMNIVVIEIEGRPAAAAFLLHYRKTTEVPWASTIRDFNGISLNMLLYWELLRVAIDRGTKVFDFGRSTVDSGPYRFKKQWGAEPVQLVWNYWLRHGHAMPELNPDSKKYALAIKLWKKLPLPISTLVGPYLVQNLP